VRTACQHVGAVVDFLNHLQHLQVGTPRRGSVEFQRQAVAYEAGIVAYASTTAWRGEQLCGVQ